MATLINGSDLVTAAKNIRRELKEAFPGTKFSVRSSRFAGGDSIDISWIDGPTDGSVGAIVNKYQEGDFDGMTDSYNYRDGSWTYKHGGAKYVHTRRDYSEGAVQGAIDAVSARFDPTATPAPTVEDYEQGNAYSTSPVIGGGYHDSWQGYIGRTLAETDL